MAYQPNPQEVELAALEQRLKTIYMSVATSYKTMSKFSDNLRLNSVQVIIDRLLAEAAEVRSRIDTLRAELMSAWSKSKQAPDPYHNR